MPIEIENLHQNLKVRRAFGPLGVVGMVSGLASLKTASRAKCKISRNVKNMASRATNIKMSTISAIILVELGYWQWLTTK